MVRLILVLLLAGSVWSRTLDGVAKDGSARTRAHGLDEGHSSGKSDLKTCTDCDQEKKEDQIEKKVATESPALDEDNNASKDESRKPAKIRSHRRSRKNRKSEKRGKPFLSISRVKVTVNGENSATRHEHHHHSRKHQEPTDDSADLTKTGQSVDAEILDIEKEQNKNTKKEEEVISDIGAIPLNKDLSKDSISDIKLVQNSAAVNDLTKSGSSGNDKAGSRSDELQVVKGGEKSDKKSDKKSEKNKKKKKRRHHRRKSEKDKTIELKIQNKNETEENHADHSKSPRREKTHKQDVKEKLSKLPATNGDNVRVKQRKQETRKQEKINKQENNEKLEKLLALPEDGITLSSTGGNDKPTGIKSVQTDIILTQSLHGEEIKEVNFDDNTATKSRRKKTEISKNTNDRKKANGLREKKVKAPKISSRKKNRKLRQRLRSNSRHSKKSHDNKDTTDGAAMSPSSIQGDRWSRPDLDKVPDVERLERRLHPTVEAPVDDIIVSLRKMLHRMQHSIYLIDLNYKHTFNTTRWDLMVGVRDELMNIAHGNDEVYDAVMDVSLHTKELYLRGHQRRQFSMAGSVSSSPYRERARVQSLDMRSKFRRARNELRSAELLQRKIQVLQRKRKSLRRNYVELTRKITEKLPSRALYDLARRANQTIQRLEYTRAMKDAIDRTHLYMHSHDSTYRDMTAARDFLQDAQDILTIVKKQLVGNQMKVKEIMKARQNVHVRPTDGFNMGHLEQWAAVDMAKLHANDLFNSAAMILMKFKPLLKQAEDIIAVMKTGKHESKFERTLRNIGNKIPMLNITMFLIRSDVCTDQYEVCSPKKEIEKEDTEEKEDIYESSGDTTTDITETTDTPKTGDRNESTEDTSDNEEIFFEESSGVDELDESSGDGSELPTESPVDVNISKSIPKEKTNVTQPNNKPPKKTTVKLSNSDDEDFIDEVKKVKKVTETPTKPAEPKKTTPKTTTILSSSDDEDIIEEIKKTKKTTETTKKTSKPSPTTQITTTTTLPPEKTTKKDEDDDSGGWFWLDDTFGFLADQFMGSSTRRKRDTGDDVQLSNITLTELIQEHLRNRTEVNEDLLSKGKIRKQSVNELQEHFNKVKMHIDQFENKTRDAKNFVTKLKAKSAEFRAVHDRVEDVYKDVEFKHEVLKEQNAKAVKKAEAKLQRMKEAYEQNKDRVNDDATPEKAKAAVELAQKVSDNIKEISTLKTLNPSPCDKLQLMDNRIRSNISELRRKIKQAKLMAASLQVAVNMEGKSHLELPVSNKENTKQARMQVQMMVKPSSEDGAIALVKTKNTGSIVISLEDYIPKVSIFDDGGYDIEDKSGESPLQKNTWYRLTLDRYAADYNLTIYNSTSILQTFITTVDVDDYPTVYNPPSTVFIGGASKKYDVDNWSGCVGDVRVNGEYLNVLNADNKKKMPKGCSVFSYKMADERSLMLDGHSYAFYKLTTRQLRSRMSTFVVNFTAQSDGNVFAVNAENNRFQAIAIVQDRKLHVLFRHNSQQTIVVSTGDVIGVEQSIKISITRRTVNVMLNGRKDTLNPTKEWTEDTRLNYQGIHIGGASNMSRSIRGCLQDMKLNDDLIPLYSMSEATGVTYGTCQPNYCVTFANNSKAIELVNMTEAESLSFVFSYGSSGRILMFYKGEKFNLTVTIDEQGLALQESVKDKSERIDLSTSDFKKGDDVVVMVTDTDKKLTVSVGDEESSFSYGNAGGGFWFFGNQDDDDDDEDSTDKNVTYNVMVGSPQNSSVDFQGNIVEFRIKDRLVDLSPYITTRNLQRCSLTRAMPEDQIPTEDRKLLIC